jgi:pentatricopeptide repeat protein
LEGLPLFEVLCKKKRVVFGERVFRRMMISNMMFGNGTKVGTHSHIVRQYRQSY